MSNPKITSLVHQINRGDSLTLRGPQTLAIARALVEHAFRAGGYELTFAPESASDLVDYLTVAGVSALQGATVGAGLGTALGLLLGRPAQGAAVGLMLGLISGAARGVSRVEHGWRIRAIWEGRGTPYVTIHKLAAA